MAEYMLTHASVLMARSSIHAAFQTKMAEKPHQTSGKSFQMHIGDDQ
jgi:hypothetical protein